MVSFFSGAMGLDIGLEQAGFQTIAAFETNSAAAKTINLNRMRLRFPELRLFTEPLNLGNVETMCSNLLDIEPRAHGVDLICGAPPCQPFSTAGKRLSVKDERAQGFEIMFKAIALLKPKSFVLENVQGVLSAALQHRPLNQRGPGFPLLKDEEHYGSAFQDLVDQLSKLCASLGYCVTWGVLNSADFGTPQVRLRLVFIGSLQGFSLWPVPTHTKDQLPGSKKWVTLRSALSCLDDSDLECCQFSEGTIQLLRHVPEGGNWRCLPEDLKEGALGKAYHSWGGRSGFLRRLSWQKPSPTITGSPNSKATLLCHPSEERPLSVRECARIQGFPDSWIFSGVTSQKYQQIGNATPVHLGKAIGECLCQNKPIISYPGKIFCAEKHLLERLMRRPKTQLNPRRMRKHGSTELDSEWRKNLSDRKDELSKYEIRPDISQVRTCQ